jgi:hypothetical protein
VPMLEILDDEGRLVWDASCLLVSTIMVPANGDRELRAQYAAQLRLEKAIALPDDETLLRKRDHVLAGKFRARKRINQIMQTRRIHSALAGRCYGTSTRRRQLIRMWQLRARSSLRSTEYRSDKINWGHWRRFEMHGVNFDL